MHRHTFSAAVTVALVFLWASPLFGQNVDTTGYNVLFISVDDLNDWVGCFGGNPQAKTPNLDKFSAGGGMVMYDAHGAATVCNPSRSSLLLGAHCYKTGVYSNAHDLKKAPGAKDLITLPQFFSKHGYHTISRGKMFHGHKIKGKPGYDWGQEFFDEWIKPPRSIWPPKGAVPLSGVPYAPKGHKRDRAFDWGGVGDNDTTKTMDYQTAAWASEQLNARDFDGKPFFMAIGIYRPHLPWYVPQKYFDMYPLEEVKLPETLANDRDDIIQDNGKPIYFEDSWWKRMEKHKAHRQAVRAYLASITFADECVGVLLDGLAKSKYAANTIVMIWGDHGWHLGEKQKYSKTLLWQESCRVPLMVKVPGVTPTNKRCHGVVSLIDMYPTLVQLCGLPANPKNDGRSFAKLLHSPDMTWNEPILTPHNRGNHRIYDGRYSYITYNGGEELYDHRDDPMEWTNLARNPEYAAIKERLKARVPRTNSPEAPSNGGPGKGKKKTRSVR